MARPYRVGNAVIARAADGRACDSSSARGAGERLDATRTCSSPCPRAWGASAPPLTAAQVGGSQPLWQTCVRPSRACVADAAHGSETLKMRSGASTRSSKAARHRATSCAWANDAPAFWHTLATARSRGRAGDASTPEVAHAATCTCAVRLAVAGEAVASATRGRVVMALSTQLMWGSGISVRKMQIKRTRLSASGAGSR